MSMLPEKDGGFLAQYMPQGPRAGILSQFGFRPPSAGPVPVTDFPGSPMDMAGAPANSINDGINSVGRPADAEPAQAEAEKPNKHKHRNEALLALGAALLGAPNFQQGLSRGIMAYQQAYQNAVDRDRPKTSIVADGAYTATTDPTTNQTTFEETPVAQYHLDRDGAKIDGRIKTAEIAADAGIERVKLHEAGATERSEAEIAGRRDVAQLKADADRDIAEMRTRSAEAVARLTQGGKAVPPAATKQITDLTNVRDELGNALKQMGPIMDDIRTGKLKFSLMSNLGHKAALATGLGANEETVRFSEYQTMLEGLRNALLIANKGVQTDGDADRAMRQLIAGNGSTASIQSNLNTVYRSLRARMGQANGRAIDVANQYHATLDGTSTQPAPARPSSSGWSIKKVD